MTAAAFRITMLAASSAHAVLGRCPCPSDLHPVNFGRTKRLIRQFCSTKLLPGLWPAGSPQNSPQPAAGFDCQLRGPVNCRVDAPSGKPDISPELPGGSDPRAQARCYRPWFPGRGTDGGVAPPRPSSI